jgi:type II restriction/modification system DNA methylase subunit YeeA
MIIKTAGLDWQTINPDILGSMLQSVVSPEERGDDEMHYTSVTNILKVISPLFLDEIYEKIQEANKDEKKLKNILKYIYNIKIFDPACGSGNFLIIAYKELCKAEIAIFRILKEINPLPTGNFQCQV